MPRRSDAVITPNDVLASARKRLPSPHRPGQYISRPELADAVNRALDRLYPERYRDALYVDARWVGKLERGESRWPVEERRAALRDVFGMATDIELDLFVPRRTEEVSSDGQGVSAGPHAGPTIVTRPLDEWIGRRRSARTFGIAEARQNAESGIDRRRAVASLATPAIAALVGAVVAPFGLDDPAARRDRVDLESLTAGVSKVRMAYQHSQYAAAASGLPQLLTNLHHTRQNAPRQAVARLEGEAYQVASGLLLKGGEPVLAAIAAERCTAAAEAAEDEMSVACGARAVVHCLLADGHAQQGVRLAVTAADRLSEHVDMNTPAAISVYGALLLRGAIAAARSEDRDQAYALLDEAASLAARLGADRNLMWTAFGPANVGAHRVAVSVDLGDAGSALAHARKIEMAQLGLPERKAMVHLDTARALAQWGKPDRAFSAIREAEREAPEEVRRRPAVLQMIHDLAQRSPTSLQHRIREYAQRISVST